MNRPSPPPEDFAPADDAIARHRDELKKRFALPSPKKQPKPRKPMVLGSCVVVLGFVAGLIGINPTYETEQFGTAVGQRQVVKLADGSHIILDGSSRVTVSWRLRTRQAELQTGQAVFEVSPARYRPFRTLAGATEITVVGTRYNVSRVQKDVRVTVEEGKVKVQGRDAGVLLTPGEQVLVRGGRLGSPTQVNARDVVGWTDGHLVFDRTPLREVLDVIQRYQQTPVVLDDLSLAELPVSGTFDSARLDRMLALLPKVLPVNVNTASNGTLHVKRRASAK